MRRIMLNESMRKVGFALLVCAVFLVTSIFAMNPIVSKASETRAVEKTYAEVGTLIEAENKAHGEMADSAKWVVNNYGGQDCIDSIYPAVGFQYYGYIKIPTDGYYTITISYSANNPAFLSGIAIYTDPKGTPIRAGSIAVPQTGAWTTLATASETFFLKAGEQLIQFGDVANSGHIMFNNWKVDNELNPKFDIGKDARKDGNKLEIQTSLDLGTGVVDAENLAKIKFNGAAVVSASVDGTTLSIEVPAFGEVSGDKVEIAEDFSVNSKKIRSAYTGYFYYYANALKTQKAAPIAKTSAVEFDKIPDGTGINPLWGTHSRILINFDMTDNLSIDFFNWNADVSLNTYADIMEKIIIDDKPLYQYGIPYTGTDVYLHYRAVGIELYLSNTIFSGNSEEHTIEFRKDFMFPNGKFLSNDLILVFTPDEELGTFAVKAVSAKVQETETVFVSQNKTLVTTFAPLKTTNKAMTYVSSDPLIATVDNSGIVTGVAGGSAVITATSVDGGFVSTCNITVENVIYRLILPENKGAKLNSEHGLPLTIKGTLTNGTQIDVVVAYTGDYSKNTVGVYELEGTVSNSEYSFSENLALTFNVKVSITDESLLSDSALNVDNASGVLEGKNADDYTTLSWNTITSAIEDARALQANYEDDKYIDPTQITAVKDALGAFTASSLIATKLLSYDPIADISVIYGAVPTLPTTIKGVFDNGVRRDVDVVWDEIPRTNTVGTLVAKGYVLYVDNTKMIIQVNIIVLNEIKSIAQLPTNKTVSLGENHGLATEVELTLADGTKIVAEITYSGVYNKTIAGDYELTGKINLNGFSLSGTLTDTFKVTVTVDEQVIADETTGCGAISIVGGSIGTCVVGFGMIGLLMVVTLGRKKRVNRS